jgi:hypothetical protein
MKHYHWEELRHFFCKEPTVSKKINIIHQLQYGNICNIIFLQCDFWSNRPKVMEGHVERVHMNKKNFLCDRCDFRAFKKAELDAHVREVSQPLFIFGLIFGIMFSQFLRRILTLFPHFFHTYLMLEHFVERFFMIAYPFTNQFKAKNDSNKSKSSRHDYKY